MGFSSMVPAGWLVMEKCSWTSAHFLQLVKKRAKDFPLPTPQSDWPSQPMQTYIFCLSLSSLLPLAATNSALTASLT